MIKKIENFKIGDKAEFSHIITDEDIKKFIELTGDDNKIHTDDKWISQTKLKKKVAHGMLSASFISTIIGTKLPGDGALWISQTIDFLNPVRVGDKLDICATITDINLNLKIIELEIEIKNQYHQKVITGKAKVKMIDIEVNDKTEEKNIIEKVILIIGATGGIGRAVTKKFIEKGYSCIIHYHSNKKIAEELLELAKKNGNNALLVRCDICDEKQIKEMFEYIKRFYTNITGFVNCSISKFANIKFQDMGWETIEEQLTINLKSNFYLIKEILPFMVKNKYGKIVFISSQSTEDVPPPQLSHYSISKSALNSFAKNLAVELAPLGIRVNIVSPGMTDTELISNLPEKAKLLTISKTLLKRLAKPEDIASAIYYLISEDSDYITGETLRVNGGQTML
ncbi:MAG TPA: SDR family oxidoreductase [bacterium]|nr:SDR family oxidoreductase [bacterium]HPQ19447.1 SDR family oxidoreductase [bacterium]